MRVMILDDLECNMNEHVFNYINKLQDLIKEFRNGLLFADIVMEEQKDLVIKLRTQLLFAQTEASELKNKSVTL